MHLAGYYPLALLASLGASHFIDNPKMLHCRTTFFNGFSIIGLIQSVACRSKYVCTFVHVHLLEFVAGWCKVLTWVEVTWVLNKVAADSSCHSQTSV